MNNNTNKHIVKIEHMFATLKQNKSIALNYSKKINIFYNFVYLSFILLHIRC